MSRWVRIYIVASALALLGCLGVIIFIFIVGKGQRNENPEIINKIVVSARVVTEKELNTFFKVSPSLSQQEQKPPNLYLLTSSQANGIGKRVIGANAEFVSPEFMKGKHVPVGVGDYFRVEKIKSSKLSDEQRTMLLMAEPQLKVIDAWIK